MSKFTEYLEKVVDKQYEDKDVQDAMENFAKEIASKKESKREDWANTIGYKKYGHIFDKLSDHDHSKAMHVIWHELVPSYD